MLRHDQIHLGMRLRATRKAETVEGTVRGLQLRECSTPEGNREDCAGVLLECTGPDGERLATAVSTHDDLTILDAPVDQAPLPFWYTDFRLGRKAKTAFESKFTGNHVEGTGTISALHAATHKTTGAMGIAVTIINPEDETKYETTHLETTLLPEAV